MKWMKTAAFAMAATALVGSGMAHAAAVKTSSERVIPASAPPGYVEVHNEVDAPPLTQTIGSAPCPDGTVIFGGGSAGAGPGMFMIGASGWQVTFYNSSPVDATFDVYAICGQKPGKYGFGQEYEKALAAHRAGSSTAHCPKKSQKVLGGAASGPSINSSFPKTGKTWRANGSNSSSHGSSITTRVVCAKKLAGQVLVKGPTVTNGAGQLTEATASCPSGAMPLSGGPFVKFPDDAYNPNDFQIARIGISSSYPSGDTWVVEENNGSRYDGQLSVYVICAGT